MNNFNLLAPVYDALARLVFGKTLHQASVHFLADIPANSRVLVLGGGTGKLLPHLKHHYVKYVEKSDKMLAMAQNRAGIGSVDFVHADFLDWETDQQFDVVICPFFLDVFTSSNLDCVLIKIVDITLPKGELIVTDFRHTGRLDHRMLLRLMHLFFGVFAKLEGQKLIDLEARILQEAYRRNSRTVFHAGFVFSAVFKLKDLNTHEN